MPDTPEVSHSGGGNLFKEFQGAKPPEKAVIIFGIVAVIGVALYLYKKGMAQTTGGTPVQGTTTQGGGVAGYPTAGGLPVLPPGVNPIFDPNGNPIGWQNPGSGTTPPTSPPPKPPPGPIPPQPSPTPTGGGTSYTVKSGDNLFNIAKMFGIANWQTIYNANKSVIGSNPNLIYPGQKLVIPPRMIASSTTVATTAGGGTH